LSHYFIIDKNGKKMKSLKVDIFALNSVKAAFFICLLGLGGFSAQLPGPLYAQERQAVLVQGNEWRTGIPGSFGRNPGFGGNTLTALFGEYQVESAAAVTGSFIVRASHEPLQFTVGQWQLWPGLDGVMQCTEGGSLLLGLPFDSPNNMGVWTIVFQFSLEPSDRGLDSAAISRLIRAWTGRFGYFFALIKSFSDISLPAVVEF
jgi:hypothetical protein